MDTKNKTMKELLDEVVSAAYDSAVARNRYEELYREARQKLDEMQKQIEEDKS